MGCGLCAETSSLDSSDWGIPPFCSDRRRLCPDEGVCAAVIGEVGCCLDVASMPRVLEWQFPMERLGDGNYSRQKIHAAQILLVQDWVLHVKEGRHGASVLQMYCICIVTHVLSVL